MTPFTASELQRLISTLPITDPTTEKYSILLHNFERLSCAVETIDMINDEIERYEGSNIVNVDFCPEGRAVEPVEQAVESVEPSEPVAQESGADIDLPTVRAALRVAKNNGVDIREFLREFGATNTADLAPEKYAEVMRKLEELE